MIIVHPSFFCTAYPAKCDGYEVDNRLQHVMHCIAHEMVHVVARFFAIPVKSPYPSTHPDREMRNGYQEALINPYTHVLICVYLAIRMLKMRIALLK